MLAGAVLCHDLRSDARIGIYLRRDLSISKQLFEAPKLPLHHQQVSLAHKDLAVV